MTLLFMTLCTVNGIFSADMGVFSTLERDDQYISMQKVDKYRVLIVYMQGHLQYLCQVKCLS